MTQDMAKHVRTTIRYDGPALAGHEMDVQDLAPALLALADIAQIANRKFNGDRSSLRVLVNADVEQKCFMLDVSLAMSLLDQAKTLFDSERVKTAKEIAEWMGIIASGTGGFVGGLFALLKFLRNKKEGGTVVTVSHSPGAVTLVLANGASMTVAPQVFELAKDDAIVERAKQVVKPLQKPGYDTLKFVEGEDEVFSVDDVEAAEIIATSPTLDAKDETDGVSNIEGKVRIKAAQYEGDAKWSLLWNGRPILAEMADDAAIWVQDFQNNKVYAPPNSILEVSMIETVKLDKDGLAIGKPAYKVTAVRSVTLPEPPPQKFL